MIDKPKNICYTYIIKTGEQPVLYLSSFAFVYLMSYDRQGRGGPREAPARAKWGGYGGFRSCGAPLAKTKETS